MAFSLFSKNRKPIVERCVDDYATKMRLKYAPYYIAMEAQQGTNVRLDDRGAWEIELADGLQVRLGRQDVKDRLERFIRLASPTVAKRVAEINYVDMRYTNGFSVGWNTRSALAVAPREDATPDA